jgi:hypothetical protein
MVADLEIASQRSPTVDSRGMAVKNVNQQVVVIFFACWVVLGIGSFVFFQRSRSGTLCLTI